jgi:hypothetical protein
MIAAVFDCVVYVQAVLRLMKDQEFRTAHPQLTILDPVSFLQHVRSQVAKELGYPDA